MKRPSLLLAILLLAVGCSADSEKPPAAGVDSEKTVDSVSTNNENEKTADVPLSPPTPVADDQPVSEEQAEPLDESLDDEARRWIALRADEDPRLRSEAEAYILDQGVRAKWLLQAAAVDSDVALRAGAAYAMLADFDGHDRATTDLFLRLLADEEPRVRNMALQAVGRFAPEDLLRAVEPLAAILTSPRESDHTRGQAARLLGGVKSSEAFAALSQAAKHDGTARVRTAALAASAASAPDDNARLALLRDRLANDSAPSVLRAAVSQINRLGAAAAPLAENLAELLSHEDESLRASVAKALANIGSPAIEALIEHLESSNARSVLGAMAALVQLDPAPQAALAPLERLKSSADPTIRSGAEAVLRKLRAP